MHWFCSLNRMDEKRTALINGFIKQRYFRVDGNTKWVPMKKFIALDVRMLTEGLDICLLFSHL
jgi:hypothetical protein